jgi:hypothetical protein
MINPTNKANTYVNKTNTYPSIEKEEEGSIRHAIVKNANT